MTTGTTWTDRVVGTGEEDPRKLKENPKNWRVHPGNQQRAMADVLDEIGFVQGILVNRRTGVVIDGHMRVALALKHNQPTVPVSYVELSDEEEAQVLASLNPLGALAYEDAEAKAHLQAAAQSEREALRALIGIVPLDGAGAIAAGETEPPDEASDRSGMEKDHTDAIAKGDDPDDDDDDLFDLGAWDDDAYVGEAIKLINFVMTAAEYGPVVDALERIGEREGHETNADTVIWLIERYGPEEVEA